MGILPKSEDFANTATDWSGTLWTEMMLPLPDERSRRDTLMLHELFHRIQDKLAFAPMRNASNAHLDALDGRYTVPLEYRALTRALNPSDDKERRAAIADALLFRGVQLGNPQPAAAQASALRDLNNQAKVPSLVRSFAYATGPAYGLLLDRYRPDWRTALQSGQTLPELLQSALKATLPGCLRTCIPSTNTGTSSNTLATGSKRP